jgi:hypothetical protein
VPKGRKLDTKQPHKLYRNSECGLCGCFMCSVKMKQHPKTDENIILCKDCYSDLYVKYNKKD